MHQTVNQQQMEDFFRYARFICDQFDIQIQLDSTKAETDGRVIYLPSVSGLSKRELDMMYAVLLHEAGHIKYSDFTPESFLKLKTQAHAALANAIEDARIENLLMKEFDGATVIFENMYCDYVLDKDLMNSLFKVPHKAKPDIFTSLGFYLHNHLLQCNSAPIAQSIGKSHQKKIIDFLNRHDLFQYISPDKIKTWDQVVDLTNLIYSKLVQEHQDKTKELNLKEDIQAKEQAQKILQDMQKKLADTKLAADDLREKINEKYEELSAIEAQNETRIAPLQQQFETQHEQYQKFQAEQKARNQVEKSLKAQADAQRQMHKASSNEKMIEQDLEQLQEKMAKGLNGHNKEMTDVQRTNLQNKIDNRLNQIKKNQEKFQSSMQEEQKAFEAVTEAEKNLDQSLNGVDNEQLDNFVNSLYESKQALENKINDILSETKSLQESIARLENKLSEIESKAQQEILSTMMKLDQGVSEQFGVNLLPGFEETPGWSSADAVQKEFDENASDSMGQIVRNGGKMASLVGTNLRDMQVLLDKTKEKVADINLKDIFSEKINLSKMPKTDVLVTKNVTDKAVVKSFGDVRKHIAITDMFDEIITKNDSKNKKEILSLEKEYFSLMRQLNQVFAKRFRFAKKDFWKGGREEGQLDARNLWKLPTNLGEDYFEENNPKFINKMASSILVDISGSQDKEESEYGKLLKMLCMAISSGLSTAHIKHEILGFHAPICEEMRNSSGSDFYNRRSNKLQTIVYKNFSQKDYYGIGNMDIQCSDNSDGESIRVAIKRLMKERAKSRALFIITDGKPYLSDANIAVLDEDLKKALREAVAQKVQIFAFGFAPNPFAFYGERFCYVQNLTDIVKFCDKMAVV